MQVMCQDCCSNLGCPVVQLVDPDMYSEIFALGIAVLVTA